MVSKFKSDIFSISRPVWTLGSIDSLSNLNSLVQYLPGDFSSGIFSVEYSGGLEINSSNFKLDKNGQSILIKRWSMAAEEFQTERVLSTMNWLSDSHMPVPRPYKFNNGSTLIQLGGYFWSCYPFIEGDYFSGKDNEIQNVASSTALLTNKLSKLPVQLMPSSGPQHLTVADNQVLVEIDKLRSCWSEFFGLEYATLLENSWSDLMSDWTRLYNSKIVAGPIMPVHFDLHPHNLIFKNSMVAAILDFESCKMMPVGYAVAFAGLKQCRQAVSLWNDVSLAAETGKNYISVISSELDIEKSWIVNFADLAIAEILRRICIILRLNMAGNQEWNRVLPVQIAHLYEAKDLFSYN